jgi:hypothetical protein
MKLSNFEELKALTLKLTLPNLTMSFNLIGWFEESAKNRLSVSFKG